MPTVLLLDVSLSMLRPLEATINSSEAETCLQMAIFGLKHFLTHMSQHCKFEFTALVVYSSLYEVLVPFTREFRKIESALEKIEIYDKTCLTLALNGTGMIILEEWGSIFPCQIVVVTDGCLSVEDKTPVNFSFPCKIHVVCVADRSEHFLQHSIPFYKHLIETSGNGGNLYLPDSPVTHTSIKTMFGKLSNEHFHSYQGQLCCGQLSSPVTLSPMPQPYHKIHDFDIVHKCVSDVINICGFMNISDVGSPPALSRHLIFPVISGFIMDNKDDDDTIPSFCVLLHGALKVRSMVALCTVDTDWFGILYSWADSKKKSNLMLTLFIPGIQAVPWLGDLKKLYPIDPENSLPQRIVEKRSYSQNCVVWIRQSGLQTDIQKLLRHARKLPEKTQHFYKELNRIRKGALSLGFYELLKGLASVLERECTLLPGNSHTDCTIQLSHAASMLRSQMGCDVKMTILPYKSRDS